MATVSQSQRPLIVLCAALLGGLLIGCEKEESISVYNAPKEPATAARPVAANTAPSAAANELHWTVPEGWKEAPAQQMRFATFIVNEGEPKVELTVIPLGPESGDVLANVNRWEGQIGLQPSPKEKLGAVVRHQKVDGLEVDVVDLTGPQDANPRQRMLAAIVPHGGRIWFFKMTGPVDIVSAQKEKFDAFIASLHPGHEGGEDAHAGHDHAADPHAGHDHAADDHAGHDHATTRTAQPISKLVKWDAPQGWNELPDSKPPRMLAFSIGQGDDAGEMIATRFGASGAGSFMDNVNRWRGQLGLPPIDDPEAVELKDATVGQDGQGVIVEFENPSASPRGGKKAVVLVASAQGDLWFFKLSGPTELIDKERPKFDAFVKSLSFGGEGDPAQH